VPPPGAFGRTRRAARRLAHEPRAAPTEAGRCSASHRPYRPRRRPDRAMVLGFNMAVSDERTVLISSRTDPVIAWPYPDLGERCRDELRPSPLPIAWGRAGPTRSLTGHEACQGPGLGRDPGGPDGKLANRKMALDDIAVAVGAIRASRVRPSTLRWTAEVDRTRSREKYSAISTGFVARSVGTKRPGRLFFVRRGARLA
jgi:hypothetical protein